MVRMKLHILIAQKQINQQELSHATGIRQSTISNYINQNYKHIVNTHIDLFCKYFDCKVSDLIEYIEDSKKD